MAYAVCDELNVPARFEKFAAADLHSAAAQTSSVVTALAGADPEAQGGRTPLAATQGGACFLSPGCRGI